MPTTLGSFWNDLPREGRLLLSVVAFEFIGSGLVLPFWVVYLHEVRGFSLETSGFLMALMPAAAVLISIPGGTLVDRLGPRVVMLFSLVAAIAGQLVTSSATTVTLAAIGLALNGVGNGLMWPSAQSLIATIVPRVHRARYFGINFALLNLGIGVGGIVGGFLADVARPRTFELLYLADAVSYLPAVFLLLVPLRRVGGPVPQPDHDDGPKPSYLSVSRRPGVLALTALSFLTAFVGYAQMSAGMPAYARSVSEVSTRGLGLAFAVNTAVIVVLQLFVLRWIDGLRRTRVIVGMSAVWALSWLLMFSTGLVPGTLAATILLASSMGVFALGETLLQPTLPAMVNDMAPDHLRGRYNAMTSGALHAAAISGPPVAGLLIGADLPALYIAGLLLGLAAVAWVAVRRVEPLLTPQANGVRVEHANVVQGAGEAP